MIFPNGFPMLGGLFSGLRQTPQQQPAMYGNQFGMPQQGGMGAGYVPPYLMQYMQQFGMPMQQPNMNMQQQAAEQYMRQFGLGQLGQPAVPGSQGFPPPGRMGTAPNAAPSGAPIQNPMLSITPEQLAQLRANQSGAATQANMLQSRRATILPPAPPTPLAGSPIRTSMAAPVNTANMGDVRRATGGSLADALRTSRSRMR